ncbi:Dehydrogenase/reductase SDR family member 1 [Aphelenchoides besseyi]|nr:Dehydrogenase/reductase SDR family member 1 [Aphelenchoides besseyi]
MTGEDKHLNGKIALVTGCSRGIGKGIATALGAAGATVYVTGRKAEQSENAQLDLTTSLNELAKEIDRLGGHGIAVYCDHSNPDEVRKLFERIASEQSGQLDILVNNAYAAVQFILQNVGRRFYELDVAPEIAYDTINNVGLRNHYVCCVHAAKLMSARKSGVIVNVSSTGGANYFLSVPYGLGKEAVDRMSADMAIELADRGVTVLSLWVGAVKTEIVQQKVLGPRAPGTEVFKDGQSLFYAGRVLSALLRDSQLLKRTGQIVNTSSLGAELNVFDIDGKQPGDPRIDQYLHRIEQNNQVRLEALKL